MNLNSRVIQIAGKIPLQSTLAVLNGKKYHTASPQKRSWVIYEVSRLSDSTKIRKLAGDNGGSHFQRAGMLDLNELDTDEIPGLSRERGNDLAQAGAVCLQINEHQPGIGLAVQGYIRKTIGLTWTLASEQAMRTWNDLEEVTEDGAAGIAALLAIKEIGYHIILRSRKTSGIDYWLGDKDISNISEPEQAATDALRELLRDNELVVRARLEVSGILSGTEPIVRARVRRKMNQTNRSDDWGLPAYILVVEFGRPLAEVRVK